MPYYAVAKGRSPGIFMSWGDCERQVKGFSGARYKKFDSIDAAQNFVKTEGGNSSYSAKSNNNSSNSIPPPKKNLSNNNLKRSYSTSSNNWNNYGESSFKSNFKRREDNSDYDDTDSYDSDDLSEIVVNQMKDIEKRLKGFGRGVDKIIEKAQGSGRKALMIEPPQAKKARTNTKSDFEEDGNGYVQVYTDGACAGNGRRGARAGLGVYWADGHPLNVSEPVSGRATNNCGEIQAATRAIKIALEYGIKKLAINTDSQFLINSVTKWMPGWKRKGWKLASGNPVKNEVDFKDLDNFSNQLDIKWNYVEAHKGIHGNEMADKLAKEGAARYNER